MELVVRHVITLVKVFAVKELNGMIVLNVSREVSMSPTKVAANVKTDIPITHLSNSVSQQPTAKKDGTQVKQENVSSAILAATRVSDQPLLTVLSVQAIVCMSLVTSRLETL